MKTRVKHFVGFIRCLLNGVKYPGGVYIGRGVHLGNSKNVHICENVQIRPYCDLFAGNVFEIGANSDIGTRNRIAGNVIIEDSVLFGPDNFICSYDHQFSDILLPILEQGEYSPKRNGHDELKIGEGSWIGTHCAIIGDVHIGKHCVIGANAVVTKDIPDYCVAVGIPAKVVKKYDFELGRWISTDE